MSACGTPSSRFDLSPAAFAVVPFSSLTLIDQTV
jgi:hypothetical protein